MTDEDIQQVMASIAKINEIGAAVCNLNPAEFILLMRAIAIARTVNAETVEKDTSDPANRIIAYYFKEIAASLHKAADATKRFIDLDVNQEETEDEHVASVLAEEAEKMMKGLLSKL